MPVRNPQDLLDEVNRQPLNQEALRQMGVVNKTLSSMAVPYEALRPMGAIRDAVDKERPVASTSTKQRIVRRVQSVKSVIVGDALNPPSAAEGILYLLLPRKDRECLFGDLEEEYKTIVIPKDGAVFGSFWYWRQVWASVGPVLWSVLKRLGVWALIVKAFEEFLRRIGN